MELNHMARKILSDLIPILFVPKVKRGVIELSSLTGDLHESNLYHFILALETGHL